MSDIEEPPVKMSKYEYLEEGSADDGMDEGQEEWLSEGILTDDDLPVAEKPETEWKTSDNSQDTTLPSTNCGSDQLDNTVESQDNMDLKPEEAGAKAAEQNIEETLNNLDSTKCVVEVLPDELNAFLIRKTDGQVVPNEDMKTQEEGADPKPPADDGNDTDDLLRMLSEDNNKSKKMSKTLRDLKSPKEDASSSDEEDDSIFETAKAKSLQAAKNVLIKKNPATKAVPEDMSEGDDETDASSDEVDTMKKMFGVAKKQNLASKSTAKSSITATQKKTILTHLNSKTSPQKVENLQSPVKQYANKHLQPKSILKKPDKVGSNPDEVRTLVTYKSVRKVVQVKADSASKHPKKTLHYDPTDKITVGSSTFKSSESKSEDVKVKFKAATAEPKAKSMDLKAKPAAVKMVPAESKAKPVEVKMKPAEVKLVSADVKGKSMDVKVVSDAKVTSAERRGKSEDMKGKANGVDEFDEIINESEFFEGDDIDLDEEEFAEDTDLEEDESRSQQRIMKPERMDEEVPTDGESHSEEGSLYDELPSSESDDMEDWFTLDIRAERAGDYIPLLGSKAREMLQEEKHRVTGRLANLRQSLTALTESGRRQAEQLRDATITLAELDDMLKAS